MQALEVFVAYALGCLSMAILIRYRQKKALNLAQAQMSQLKTNRVPENFAFEDVNANSSGLDNVNFK